MLPPPNPPAPAPPTTPAAPAPGVDTLLNQVNQGAAEATAAVQQATATAQDIAGDITAVETATPGASPIPAPATPPAPPAPAAKTPDSPLSDELRQLLAIEVPIIVQLGIRRMAVAEVMRFSVGAIVEFQKAADEALDLLANNKPIGKGHAVKVGENFGIKLTTVGSVKETIRALGAA